MLTTLPNVRADMESIVFACHTPKKKKKFHKVSEVICPYTVDAIQE